MLSLLIELDLEPLDPLDCCDLDLFLDCLVSGVSKGFGKGCCKSNKDEMCFQEDRHSIYVRTVSS